MADDDATLPGPGGKPITRLEGWISLPEIGEFLGISRQGVHSMVFEYATFPVRDMRFVGRPEHPMYLVRESAWKAELDRRAHAAKLKEDAARQAEAERAVEARTIELRREMRGLLGDAGIVGKEIRNDYVSRVLGQPVDDWYNRTAEEATKVITQLRGELRLRAKKR